MSKKLVIVPELLKAHVKSFTRKTGKRMKTGEESFEYSASDSGGEHRAWVTRSGHLMDD